MKIVRPSHWIDYKEATAEDKKDHCDQGGDHKLKGKVLKIMNDTGVSLYLCEEHARQLAEDILKLTGVRPLDYFTEGPKNGQKEEKKEVGLYAEY